MAELHDVLSPFQEFKKDGVGEIDFLVIPDAPFRFSFAGVERGGVGAVTVSVEVVRVLPPPALPATYPAFQQAVVTASASPSWFLPGPVGYVKIPRGYGVRVLTTGIAGAEVSKCRIVIEKMVDY